MFSLLAATYLWDLPIALAIHSLDNIRTIFSRLIAGDLYRSIRSLDRTLGALKAGAQCAPYIHAIARIIQSVDRRGSLSQWLFAPLISPAGAFQAGAQCAPYILSPRIIQSVDRTRQDYRLRYPLS